MRKSTKKQKTTDSRPLGRRIIPWGLLVIILFAVGLFIGNLKTRETSAPATVAVEPSAQPPRDVILYFAAPDGQTLVAESATINDCTRDEDCLRDTVLALIAGPQGDLAPILPSQVSLLDARSEGSLIILDFSRELVAAHPGGTQSELLTIYGLADTLAANFPHLRQLQIYVDGAPLKTIKGHVDLRQPIHPDFSFVEEGAAPIGKIDAAPAGGGQ